MEILLIKPRGFCAGVEYAIIIVEEVLKLFKEPIYILKEIVHNKQIVHELSIKGAKSIDSIQEIPPNSIVIFSAHGVPPEFHLQAKNKNFMLSTQPVP